MINREDNTPASAAKGEAVARKVEWVNDASNINDRRMYVDGSQWAKIYGWDKASLDARCDALEAALTQPHPSQQAGAEAVLDGLGYPQALAERKDGPARLRALVTALTFPQNRLPTDAVLEVYADSPTDKAHHLAEDILAALQPHPSQQAGTTFSLAEWNEAGEIGERDGYEKAIQDLDLATGGDGEFRGSTDPTRCVDMEAMKARIIKRFTPSQQAGTGVIRAADAKWLSNWLAREKDSGHCGEGTFERRERASWNDRIDRILAALTSEVKGQ